MRTHPGIREVQELYMWLPLKQKHRGSLDTQDPQPTLSTLLSLRVETTMSLGEEYEELQNSQVPNQLLTKSSPSKPFTGRLTHGLLKKSKARQRGACYYRLVLSKLHPFFRHAH